jgi:hypothetical protein
MSSKEIPSEKVADIQLYHLQKAVDQNLTGF